MHFFAASVSYHMGARHQMRVCLCLIIVCFLYSYITQSCLTIYLQE